MYSKYKQKFLIVISFLVVLQFCSCQTGVENSPSPGIVRVMLRANPNDTYIINRSDTFHIFNPYYKETYFRLNIFQGAVFSGDKFAILYKNIKSYRQEDSVYNFAETNYTKEQMDTLVQHLLTGKSRLADLSADYKAHTIFESYVPPGHYNSLRFGVNASKDVRESRMICYNIYGVSIRIPLEVADSEELLKYLDVDFDVTADKVTQINVEIDLFKTVYRYRDSYRLDRKLRILNVEYF
ncbi:MAG: DUF4382 domain-containing protein [Ignavibacteriales bacterium]|nr:DUF4382 domain-containing protein [Ignavibacteriales bacterium]